MSSEVSGRIVEVSSVGLCAYLFVLGTSSNNNNYSALKLVTGHRIVANCFVVAGC